MDIGLNGLFFTSLGYHQLFVVTQPNWPPIAASSAGVLQVNENAK